jgi:hypothetical protein
MRDERHSRSRRRLTQTPAARDADAAHERMREPRALLARILETPQLAHVVPQMPASLLHRVIQHCGLEDCGELIALATGEQLMGVLDRDLWRSTDPGLDEGFDAGRFGVWLDVLVESGVGLAAQKLSAIDADLLIAAFGQHIRVFDPASLVPSVQSDDEGIEIGRLSNDTMCEVGGYAVFSRNTPAWDAIVALLVELDEAHPATFQRLMCGCRSMSNSTPEVDGLDDLLMGREQVLFDVAFDRERRQDRQGFVTPPQARAFLQEARQTAIPRDAGNPIASAHFRAMGAPEPAVNAPDVLPPDASAPDNAAAAVAAIAELLFDERTADRPRLLLGESARRHSRLDVLQRALHSVNDRDHAVYLARIQELAFLGNVILAGCSLQGRPFSPQEASDAAVAVCSLGLQNWPSPPHESPAAEAVLFARSLVDVFERGWSILYREVSLYTARALADALPSLRCADAEIQAGLDTLTSEMKRCGRDGEPWRAAEALDVITSLDMPTWAALVGLTGECPVIHAGMDAARRGTRSVSATAFAFISDNAQIQTVYDFLRRLSERLTV